MKYDLPKRMCGKLFKEDLTISSVYELYYECLQNLTRKIMADASHPPHDQSNLLPSGSRLRVSRHRDGAVPSAIGLFNTVK